MFKVTVALLVLLLMVPAVGMAADGKKPVGYLEPDKKASGGKKAKPIGAVEPLIKMVEDRFAATSSMTGRFMQRFYDSAMMDESFSEGVFQIKKPMKMRWQYEKPALQTVVSDGKVLYLYVPEDKQVMIRKIGGIIDVSSPALFLAGKQRLKKIFDVELDEAANADRIDGTLTLRLTPKRKNLNVERINLHVWADDGRLRSFSVFDWAGNRTDIEFLDMKVNEDLEDANFHFKTPKGVEEIDLEAN